MQVLERLVYPAVQKNAPHDCDTKDRHVLKRLEAAPRLFPVSLWVPPWHVVESADSMLDNGPPAMISWEDRLDAVPADMLGPGDDNPVGDVDGVRVWDKGA